MEYFKIGKINSTHGLNGAVSIQVEPNVANHLKTESFIFIEIKNQSYIPYRISEIKKENQEFYILNFKGYDSIEEAKELTGKNLWLEATKFNAKERVLQSNYLSSYSIEDASIGYIGKINNITETAGQMLAFVDYKGQEVIIPMNADLILEIKEEEDLIIMELPEGLLDIYLD